MSALLPPGLTPGRRGSALALAATIVGLAVPMVIVTLALVPALVICPFPALPAACPYGGERCATRRARSAGGPASGGC